MQTPTLVAIVAGFLAVAGLVYLVSANREVPKQLVQPIKEPAFFVDPHKDNTLVIQGWDQAELSRILADFAVQYNLPAKALPIERLSDRKFVMALQNGLDPKLLFFLVNYLQYPRDFDLKQHSIQTVARVTLTSAFDAPDTVPKGERVIIYVPTNDTDYDLVYVATESGQAYRISFTNLAWKQVGDARMPAGIRGL